MIDSAAAGRGGELRGLAARDPIHVLFKRRGEEARSLQYDYTSAPGAASRTTSAMADNATD